MESKLRVIEGVTRMLLRVKLDTCVDKTECPLDVTRILLQLPTIIEEADGGRHCRSIPSEDDICEEASMSTI